MPSDRSRRLVAIHDWHLAVHEDDVERRLGLGLLHHRINQELAIIVCLDLIAKLLNILQSELDADQP